MRRLWTCIISSSMQRVSPSSWRIAPRLKTSRAWLSLRMRISSRSRQAAGRSASRSSNESVPFTDMRNNSSSTNLIRSWRPSATIVLGSSMKWPPISQRSALHILKGSNAAKLSFGKASISSSLRSSSNWLRLWMRLRRSYKLVANRRGSVQQRFSLHMPLSLVSSVAFLRC